MSILGGNLIYKAAFNLRCRLVSLPWLKKSDVLCSPKDRAYCSAFPVRYIPKKSEEPENCAGNTAPKNNFINKKSIISSSVSDMFGYEKIDGQENSSWSNAPRNSVTTKNSTIGSSNANMYAYDRMDGQEAGHGRTILSMAHEMDNHKSLSEFSVGVENGPNDDIALDTGLDFENMEEHREFDEELEVHNGCSKDVHKLQGCNTKLEAEKLAIELLATRAFTAMELRKKLNAKHFPHNIIEGVIHDFSKRGLINDCLYAEMFSRSRWSSSSWGPRRVKHELLKKGVSHRDVDEAVKLVFQDEEAGNEGLRVSLSKSSIDQLYVQASKQWLRGQDVPLDKRKARIIRWLKYRGFDWDIVGIILKKLESQYSL
ncbi:hypothetical protein Ancab_004599 [Ancistrocladus abbreviatus]